MIEYGNENETMELLFAALTDMTARIDKAAYTGTLTEEMFDREAASFKALHEKHRGDYRMMRLVRSHRENFGDFSAQAIHDWINRGRLNDSEERT